MSSWKIICGDCLEVMRGIAWEIRRCSRSKGDDRCSRSKGDDE